MEKDIDLSFLASKWPSAVVARESVSEFSGGVLTAKYMANLDSAGQGPDGAIRMGRKVVYPVTSLVLWMEGRAKLRVKKKGNAPEMEVLA